MLNTIFLGLVYPNENENEILNNSKVGLQVATNSFQWKIINGLREFCNVLTVSSLPVASFPKYKKIYINKYNSEDLICFSYVNLPIIKQITRFIKATYLLIKKCKSIGINEIIVYQPYLPNTIAALICRFFCKKVKVTIIVADMVGKYGVLPPNPFKKMVRLLYGNINDHFCKKYDRFIVVTNQMISALNVSDKPSLIIEAIADEELISKNIIYSDDKVKTIFYSGSLGRKSNALELVHQFNDYGNNNYLLQICGSGGDSLEIKKIAEMNKNIQYLGFLSHKKAIEYQNKADILVNPRKNDIFAKYSFPSKLIEYLSTGKPVITYKLDGIPEEYNNYLFYFDESVNMMESIDNVLKISRDDLIKRGNETIKFIKNNKTAKNQSYKIYKFITENNS